jgi:uncharacterized peroxidase-related enzyme
LVARTQQDFRSAGLDEKRVAMLEYAEKLTLTPSAMRRADVERLRRVGFNDADILAIAEVTSYYAYVNRIADGLGVEVEDWFIPQ